MRGRTLRLVTGLFAKVAARTTERRTENSSNTHLKVRSEQQKIQGFARHAAGSSSRRRNHGHVRELRFLLARRCTHTGHLDPRAVAGGPRSPAPQAR
jgi:hypothetical protein